MQTVVRYSDVSVYYGAFELRRLDFARLCLDCRTMQQVNRRETLRRPVIAFAPAAATEPLLGAKSGLVVQMGVGCDIHAQIDVFA